MKPEVWGVLVAVCVGAAGAEAQEKKEPRRWTGVKGAGPVTLAAPEGCFLYKDYVVLEKSSEDEEGMGGNDILVKDRRKLPAKATPAQLCVDDGQHVVVRRPAKDADFFAGIYRGLLLVDSGTWGKSRSLTFEPLAGGKEPKSVGYNGNLPVRARGGRLLLPAPGGEGPQVQGNVLRGEDGARGLHPARRRDVELHPGRRGRAPGCHARPARGCVRPAARLGTVPD